MKKLISKSWFIALMAMIATGLFYFIRLLKTGSVPTVDNLLLNNLTDPFTELNLPIQVNRASDIIFVFFFIFLIMEIINLIKNTRSRNLDNEFIESIWCSLIAGLVIGFFGGLLLSGGGILFGLLLGLLMCFSGAFILTLMRSVFSFDGFDFKANLRNGLGTGLGFFTGSNLTLFLGIGLSFGLIFMLPEFLLIYWLTSLVLKHILKLKFWKNVTQQNQRPWMKKQSS